MIDTSVSLPDLDLTCPILTASGTFGFGEELQDVIDLSRLGGIVLKSITPEPREGNEPPRVVETPSGMINSIGLENPGLDHFVAEDLPRLQDIPTRIIASVAGFSADEYVRVIERMQEEDPGVIDAFELNFSCPNTEARGVCFGMDEDLTGALTEKAVRASERPVIVKLSPNVTDIRKIARAAVEGGTDMLSLINTLIAMDINWREREPALGAGLGGLSGPAIRPVALRMTWEVATAVDVPVIGIGGIMDMDDVLKFIVAGASAVQVGTGTFVDPGAPVDIRESLEKKLEETDMNSLDELRGTLEMPGQHEGEEE